MLVKRIALGLGVTFVIAALLLPLYLFISTYLFYNNVKIGMSREEVNSVTPWALRQSTPVKYEAEWNGYMISDEVFYFDLFGSDRFSILFDSEGNVVAIFEL